MLDLILIKLTEHALRAINPPKGRITIIDRGYDTIIIYDHPSLIIHNYSCKFNPFIPYTIYDPLDVEHGFTGPRGLTVHLYNNPKVTYA
jgi:hypothetical protein